MNSYFLNRSWECILCNKRASFVYAPDYLPFPIDKEEPRILKPETRNS